MKKSIIIIFGYLLFSCQKITTDEIPFENFNYMVEIKNENLKQLIKEYSTENLPEEGKGVIMVDVINNFSNSSFIIYSSLSENLKQLPPSHYTFLNNIPILFYTGIESQILFDSLYLDKLEKDISSFLVSYIVDNEGDILQVPPNYNPKVWEIKVVGDSLVKTNMN